MSKGLAATQERFFAYLLDQSEDAVALIVDDAQVGARRRMNIYRNAYRVSLKAVLADHFERLHAYLGDEQFDNIATAFVAAYPSKLRNLRYYGAEFADFLDAHFPDDGELAELAALDWNLRHAFDAADRAPLSVAMITAMGAAWIEQDLMLHPSAHRLKAEHNVVAIWTALDQGATPPPAERLEQAIPLIVWRQETQPQFRSLTSDEANALKMLADRCSFAALSGRLVDTLGEDIASQLLGGWLARWIADGVLVVAD